MRKLDTELIAGRYRKVKLIGRGGFAEVFLAEDTRLGNRRLALKLLAPHLLDEERLRKFQQEAEIIGHLTSQNTVRAFDFGQHSDGNYYIAMEYIQGKTLHEVLKQEGSLTVERSLNIGIQILDALEEAHELSIIHRDLKPKNIMLVPQRHGELVKVLDFGVARILRQEDDEESEWTLVGTATYMAPEQAQGRPISAASDLYSVGVLLYHCITGQPPFTTQEDPVAIMIHHATKPVKSMFELKSNLKMPKSVDDVILRSLAKDPQERYASSSEFRDALEQAFEELLDDKATSQQLELDDEDEMTTVSGTPPLVPSLTLQTLNTPPHDERARQSSDEALIAQLMDEEIQVQHVALDDAQLLEQFDEEEEIGEGTQLDGETLGAITGQQMDAFIAQKREEERNSAFASSPKSQTASDIEGTVRRKNPLPSAAQRATSFDLDTPRVMQDIAQKSSSQTMRTPTKGQWNSPSTLNEQESWDERKTLNVPPEELPSSLDQTFVNGDLVNRDLAETINDKHLLNASPAKTISDPDFSSLLSSQQEKLPPPHPARTLVESHRSEKEVEPNFEVTQPAFAPNLPPPPKNFPSSIHPSIPSSTSSSFASSEPPRAPKSQPLKAPQLPTGTAIPASPNTFPASAPPPLSEPFQPKMQSFGQIVGVKAEQDDDDDELADFAVSSHFPWVWLLVGFAFLIGLVILLSRANFRRTRRLSKKELQELAFKQACQKGAFALANGDSSRAYLYYREALMNKPNSPEIKQKIKMIRQELNLLRMISKAKKLMVKGRYIQSYQLLRALHPTPKTRREKERLIHIMKPVLSQMLVKFIRRYSRYKRTYPLAAKYCRYLAELTDRHRLNSRCRRVIRYQLRHR